LFLDHVHTSYFSSGDSLNNTINVCITDFQFEFHRRNGKIVTVGIDILRDSANI